VKKPTRVQSRSGIVLFYPGHLLMEQIRDWAQRRGGCRYAVSFERAIPLIRKRLRRAELSVVDATEDPAQASDTFLQAIGLIGAEAVAMYTEKMHDDLELLVRMMRAPLLLGPMRMEEWEEFLDHKFPAIIPLDLAGTAGHQSQREMLQTVDKNADHQVFYYKPIAG
jgi:hypothetical protein